MRRLLAVLALLAVGCASTPLGPVLVQGGNGSIIALDIGGDAVTIRNPEEGVRVAQPTWSPGGQMAAWTEIETGGAVIAMGNADRQRRLETDTAPFYYYWSPDGSRLAYLGNAADGSGISLGMVDVAGGTQRTVDSGAPYFFDWRIDSSALAIHVANRLLAILDLEGNRSPIAVDTGPFQAPAFLPDGRIVVITADHFLAAVSATGDVTRLAPVAGLGLFAVGGGGELVAFSDNSTGPVLGELRTVPVTGGPVTVVDPGPVAGFEWDPTGSKLLYFTFDVEAAQLIPNVAEGGEITRYPGFVPGTLFLSQYLPFWDQYSRSLTLWSAEGDAFLLPAAGDGILFQRLDGDPPQRLVGGVFASWLPEQ
jgi:hypothetical protein